MELRQLQYFIAIVDEANFTRAAKKVFVSQSALSQQIQALEEEIGTVLLDRSRQGVSVTSAGAILYRHARKTFLELEQAQVAIQELEGLKRGELSIGVVQTVNAYLMPIVVTSYSKQFPEIKLSIDELSSDDIEAGLARGELQVGVSFAPPATAVIDSCALFEEQLVLVVNADHPLSGEIEVPVKALNNLPMVMLANTFCTRRLWEENARLASAQPHIMMEMNTVSSILSVVLRSGLATVLPGLTLTEDHPENLVSIKLHSPIPTRTVSLLWHRDNFLCAASREFINTVRHVSSEFSVD